MFSRELGLTCYQQLVLFIKKSCSQLRKGILAGYLLMFLHGWLDWIWSIKLAECQTLFCVTQYFWILIGAEDCETRVVKTELAEDCCTVTVQPSCQEAAGFSSQGRCGAACATGRCECGSERRVCRCCLSSPGERQRVELMQHIGAGRPSFDEQDGWHRLQLVQRVQTSFSHLGLKLTPA